MPKNNLTFERNAITGNGNSCGVFTRITLPRTRKFRRTAKSNVITLRLTFLDGLLNGRDQPLIKKRISSFTKIMGMVVAA